MKMGKYEQNILYMSHAIAMARRASGLGEVPVGAVIVQDGKILSSACNRTVRMQDATAHAEILAIREAGICSGNHRLVGATLYITLEPCIMCAGAILQARISNVVFGAFDERYGAAGSQLNLLESRFLNHRCEVESGVLQKECQGLLQSFFQKRRHSCR